MTIEKIANKYKKRFHPDEVWANIEMDELRRKECLCINCERKNDKPPYSSCPIAKKLYGICKEYDMAIAVTRCGATDTEINLLYLPLTTSKDQ
ncbi:MAG: hypothetical protein PHQ66_01430 [Candidatus Nanoarchaeia archaeon]|nr:hypothetical protein [Candidatus Nanoarchaeia archaeon]MDD5357962.1 hypothetical protein [Candidatus Nanoarchaeia archaeon]MDD5588881.1 hypothetical protein [Candidatus Nanoarchaeia archaeon]